MRCTALTADKVNAHTGRPSCRVEEIAKKRGITMAQVAVAWVLSKDGVTAPIVGTTNLDNLKDILGALSHILIMGGWRY